MLPGILLGIFLGGKMHRRFSAEKFAQFLYGILVMLGIILIVF
jgi:uncharacterized membrane protein YfcA